MFSNHPDFDPVLRRIKHFAALSDTDGNFPIEEFREMRQAGLLSQQIKPGKLSFKSDSLVDNFTLLKSIGKASLPVGRIFEGHMNALQLIDIYGTTAQKKRWYDEVTDSQKLFGVWNTQDQDGLFAHERADGNFILQGSKTFCSGGDQIQRPLVTAELKSPSVRGWQMCIIPTEKVAAIRQDKSFWRPLGMRASASFRMDFTGIILSKDNFLGAPNDYYKQPHFSSGAIRFCSVQLGGAEAVLEETHQLLKSINRTEDTFQKARIAEMSFLIETGNLWMKEAADKIQSGKYDSDQIIAYVNMARSMIEEICIRCMALSERSVGARGLLRPENLERIHRDLTTYLRQPAPDASLVSVGDFVFKKPEIKKLWEPQVVK
ncbi:acyl-CoA/acyl-ACP dehydrogenase [Dyadobacter sp. CY345]|uniref:acyl-CoA dehydrogenase family protein n=1 Tax=Dyadobacter sp. CY345 TaxID=2909335 RepID=UPI001F2778D4|nr:acyl-CoA dehydrogenase family protein [Dyadobacter sp. CY345]MCF2447687.1 acyl-CoA/acyl-ACP dehydrogenase [Dyadobacter sp. CY345]